MQKTSYVVISAPSGCGKDTIIEKVCQRLDGIGVSVSCTTRDPRPKNDDSYEQHGVDYFFIKRSEFDECVNQNGFLEYADNNGELYGTPRAYVEKLRDEGNDIIILNIDNQGAAQIKATEPTAISIFILPPSAQELRRRLINRKSEKTLEQVEKRIAKGKEQMQMSYVYDYVVMNDDLEAAVEDVVHIISTVRHRTMLHKELIDQINATFADV